MFSVCDCAVTLPTALPTPSSPGAAGASALPGPGLISSPRGQYWAGALEPGLRAGALSQAWILWHAGCWRPKHTPCRGQRELVTPDWRGQRARDEGGEGSRPRLPLGLAVTSGMREAAKLLQEKDFPAAQGGGVRGPGPELHSSPPPAPGRASAQHLSPAPLSDSPPLFYTPPPSRPLHLPLL